MYVDHYGIIIFGEEKSVFDFAFIRLFFFYRSNMSLLHFAQSTMSLMNKSSVYKFLPI